MWLVSIHGGGGWPCTNFNSRNIHPPIKNALSIDAADQANSRKHRSNAKLGRTGRHPTKEPSHSLGNDDIFVFKILGCHSNIRKFVSNLSSASQRKVNTKAASIPAMSLYQIPFIHHCHHGGDDWRLCCVQLFSCKWRTLDK